MTIVKASDLINEFGDNSIQVVRVGYFEKQPNLEKDSYQTNLSAFIFPISGLAKIQFDDEIYVAEPGKVIHGCQNKQISFNVLGNEKFKYINIYYISYSNCTNTDYIYSVFEMKIKNYDLVIKSLNNILEISNKSEITSKLKLQIHINLFLRKLFSEQNYKIHDSESDLVSDIIEFISKYYMEDISLKKLSGRYGESINHLSYVFYKYTKIRPIDYLIKYRMAVATRLLEEGNSVKKVASAVGYNDEFYFSRLFKKHVGVVPSKIKNKNISVITEGENNEW